MSRARPDRRLLCLALLLGVALSASGADNLAPQAAYAVTIYGFAYRGQVIPGTNTPNTVDGYLPAPPWQGPADTLTDGRRDTPAVESWFWTHMDKRLVATFDLRRQATLTAVRAYLKQGTKDAYSGAEVRIAAEADGLDKAPALPLELTADGAVWQGGPVSGRFVRLTCNSPAPTISLAEVEIEGTSTGDIAPGAPPPGLTPVAPRDLGPLTALPERPAGISNVAARPEVKLTVTSRHYDHKVGAMVDDQCAAESDPGGRALCDGDVKTTVSSFSDYYAHKSITAEFDLGDGYQIDRVVVWSATHEGPPRTYLNSFRLWLQPAAGAAWLPAGETRNPVLPGEKPPAPYPIVSAPLDRPARSVRLRLDGVAQSADVMRVAEIEIWGKALTEPVAALPLRVTAPVPAIAPVALGKLAPAYDWITKRRLRGLYSYVGRSDDEALNQRAVAVGYNCLIVHTMGKSHSEQGWPEEVTRWVEVQKRTPLRVIFSWPFGADERYGNTQFGAYQPGGGDVWKKTPCPLAAEYWNRVVGDRAVIAAKAGLTGMVVDMEMYAADSTRYRGPCVCDRCWQRFLAGHLEGVRPDEVALADRPAWLDANGLLPDYRRSQELGVMAILRDIERRVHEANPNFLLGNLLDTESLPGLARGFGTPTMPALIFSETEYGGNTAGLDGRLARLAEQGYPALYVPGLYPRPVLPDQLAKLIPQVSLPSAGFWVWSCLVYDDNAKAPYGHAEGHTAEEYWQATQKGIAALDAALPTP